jgi:hypothetical protein
MDEFLKNIYTMSHIDSKYHFYYYLKKIFSCRRMTERWICFLFGELGRGLSCCLMSFLCDDDTGHTYTSLRVSSRLWN